MERIPIDRSEEERQQATAERLALAVIIAAAEGRGSTEVLNRHGSPGELHEIGIYDRTAREVQSYGFRIEVNCYKADFPTEIEENSISFPRPLTYDLISIRADDGRELEEPANPGKLVTQIYPPEMEEESHGRY